MKKMKRHILPADQRGEKGDVSWYYRLPEFSRKQVHNQVAWKRDHPGLSDDPCENPGNRGHYYPHIIPREKWTESLYPGIRGDVLEYCEREGVALHIQRNNLLSSQVCCFNLYFHLRRNTGNAARVLSPLLPGVEEVRSLEFEFTGPIEVTEWLGEPPGGRRGMHRTSADVAIYWRDVHGHECLTLVEFKFTEQGFGTCGGYRSRGNTQKYVCETIDRFTNPSAGCYLSSGRSRQVTRRYWQLMENSSRGGELLDMAVLGESRGCPFRGPLYQLLRLELLAEYFRGYVPSLDRVEVAVVSFEENELIFRIPDELVCPGVTGLDELWRVLLNHDDEFRTCRVEALLAEAGSTGNPDINHWLDWFARRYGLINVLEQE